MAPGMANGSSGNLSGLARALSHGNGLANGSAGPYEPKSILVSTSASPGCRVIGTNANRPASYCWDRYMHNSL
jgi:hypothetical protein